MKKFIISTSMILTAITVHAMDIYDSFNSLDDSMLNTISKPAVDGNYLIDYLDGKKEIATLHKFKRSKEKIKNSDGSYHYKTEIYACTHSGRTLNKIQVISPTLMPEKVKSSEESATSDNKQDAFIIKGKHFSYPSPLYLKELLVHKAVKYIQEKDSTANETTIYVSPCIFREINKISVNMIMKKNRYQSLLPIQEKCSFNEAAFSLPYFIKYIVYKRCNKSAPVPKE
jgi:hypothetical protein